MTYGPLRQASALYQQNSVAGVESADPHQLVKVHQVLRGWTAGDRDGARDLGVHAAKKRDAIQLRGRCDGKEVTKDVSRQQAANVGWRAELPLRTSFGAGVVRGGWRTAAWAGLPPG